MTAAAATCSAYLKTNNEQQQQRPRPKHNRSWVWRITTIKYLTDQQL